MRLLAFVLTALSASAVAQSARAEGARAGDDQAMLALAVGGFSAIVPITIGGARAGRTDINHSERDQGWVAAASGFVLAPLTAHLVTGEYARGAIFTAVPGAATLGISALVLANPDAIYAGDAKTRIAFALLFTTGAVGSAVGVIDAAFAPERRRRAASEPRVSLDVGPGSLGLRGVW